MSPRFPPLPFKDQVVNLQALPLEKADPALALFCPFHTLRFYVDRTFRTLDKLFVCSCGQQKGKAVSKQRLSHWIVDAILLTYQAQGQPCPLGVRALYEECSILLDVGSWHLLSRHLWSCRLGDT